MVNFTRTRRGPPIFALILAANNIVIPTDNHPKWPTFVFMSLVIGVGTLVVRFVAHFIRKTRQPHLTPDPNPTPSHYQPAAETDYSTIPPPVETQPPNTSAA
ncbi:MAG: hypothetical protein J2P46_07715 [Zavarzinella sp.]|nr:hypothetical protein [Zavarzinella sp.]